MTRAGVTAAERTAAVDELEKVRQQISAAVEIERRTDDLSAELERVHAEAATERDADRKEASTAREEAARSMRWPS